MVITESAVIAAPSVEGGAYAVLRIAFRYAVDGEHRIGRRVSQSPALMTKANADAVAPLIFLGVRLFAAR